MSKEYPYQFVHSTYVKHGNGDAVIVNEKHVETNESRLKVVRNPTIDFWLTKPGLRNHKYKKEFAFEHELDRYTVDNYNLGPAINKAMGGNPFRKVSPKQMCESPYVYGADIDIEIVLKYKYKQQCKRQPSKYKVGMLDIEQSVLGNNEINIISFTTDDTVYCAVYEPFLKPGEGVEDIKRVVDKLIGSYLKKHGFKVVYYVDKSELNIIKWCFSKIHEDKADFIGIWNMGYDIPTIMERLEFRGADINEVMCHPEVPKDLKYVKYKKESKEKLEHFTDKWDWVNIAGYSQFYDAMCLYSRLRKGDRKSFYTLDFISKLELGEGKLSMAAEKGHYVMQSEHFLEYIAYNIIDTVLLVLMERKNHDVISMVDLIGNSRLSDFAKQTTVGKHDFYVYCRDRKAVPATASGDNTTEFDKYIKKKGGTVLDSNNTIDTGVPILMESTRATKLHKCVCDVDVKAEYPYTTMTFNISKQTKLSACLKIEGFTYDDIEDFFSNVVATEENAVYVASKFFGLPDYDNVEQLFNEYVKNNSKQ